MMATMRTGCMAARFMMRAQRSRQLSRAPGRIPPDIFATNATIHPDCSFNPTLKALLPIFP